MDVLFNRNLAQTRFTEPCLQFHRRFTRHIDSGFFPALLDLMKRVAMLAIAILVYPILIGLAIKGTPVRATPQANSSGTTASPQLSVSQERTSGIDQWKQEATSFEYPVAFTMAFRCKNKVIAREPTVTRYVDSGYNRPIDKWKKEIVAYLDQSWLSYDWKAEQLVVQQNNDLSYQLRYRKIECKKGKVTETNKDTPSATKSEVDDQLKPFPHSKVEDWVGTLEFAQKQKSISTQWQNAFEQFTKQWETVTESMPQGDIRNGLTLLILGDQFQIGVGTPFTTTAQALYEQTTSLHYSEKAKLTEKPLTQLFLFATENGKWNVVQYTKIPFHQVTENSKPNIQLSNITPDQLAAHLKQIDLTDASEEVLNQLKEYFPEAAPLDHQWQKEIELFTGRLVELEKQFKDGVFATEIRLKINNPSTGKQDKHFVNFCRNCSSYLTGLNKLQQRLRKKLHELSKIYGDIPAGNFQVELEQLLVSPKDKEWVISTLPPQIMKPESSPNFKQALITSSIKGLGSLDNTKFLQNKQNRGKRIQEIRDHLSSKQENL